jgi:hypothetical protein
MHSSLEDLSTLLNTTFAKASSNNGTSSVTSSFSSNGENIVLSLRFQTIFHFAAHDKYSQQHTLREQTKRASEEAVQIVNDCVKKLKDDFKAKTGKSLSIKQIDFNENVEFLPSTMQAQKKTAYFRRTFRFDVLV